MDRILVTTIGWRAHAALARSAGVARSLGAPSGYLEAGGELVWLGTTGDALHARAILTDGRPSLPGTVCIDSAGAAIWQPHAVGQPPSTQAFATAGKRLRDAIDEIGEPRGLGALVAGRMPAFPLEAAVPAARALAGACAAGDAAGAWRAAATLIGLGPGLTPSGDDFVGGAFFARAALVPEPSAEAWARTADQVRALAGSRTHPVSATLLADLLAGHGWAPLHELALGVATGDDVAAIAAARRLVHLGHSSGWDLLAGFLAALPGGGL